MNTPTPTEPDPQVIAAVVAEVEHPDPAVVQAAAGAVARALAGIDAVFVDEALDSGDGSLRVDVWESAVVQFEDLLPEEYHESWEQESGAALQVSTSGSGPLQDVLAAAVDVAVKRLA